MEPLPLDTQVRRLLLARTGDLKKIAADLEISYSWLIKFRNDRMPNPSYSRLIALRNVLLGLPATPEGKP